MGTTKITAWLSMLCLAGILLVSATALAATQIVEADGYYTVGDGAEENFSVAQERAKQDALGRAAEKAAVYVEKFTAVKNHQLMQSEIRTLAAKVLNVMDMDCKPFTEGNVIKFHCHVVARVEDEGAFASLLSDRQKLEESLRREREKDEKIAELNRQMEELQKQYQAAKTDGERAAIRREAQANDASFTAAQWVGRGNRSYDNGEYSKAIECYNKAIALSPDYAAAYYNLGNAYFNNGEYSKAIESCNKAIALKPDNADAYNNLGSAYLYKGEYSKAIESYNKAIALKPDDALAYYNLGYAYHIMGEYSKAIESYNKAIALKPDYAFAYNNLGNVYKKKGEYSKAIECCNKAIALEPDFASAYNNRGAAYVGMGDRKKAKRDFAKAYELEPNNKKYRENKRESENW